MSSSWTSLEKAPPTTPPSTKALTGLRIAAGLGISRLIVQGDSQLMVNQVNKTYECPQTRAYIEEVHKMERRFDGLQLEHIPHRQNTIADEL
jgi:ribonuclease HI